MPRNIKYATVGSHSLSNTASVSGALVTDGTTGSATPLGRCRLVSLECTIASGTSLSTAANVPNVYLAKDADGYHPITDANTTTKLGTLFTSAIGGFSIRLEQDAYIEGPVYAVGKLAASDSGTGTWKLTFVQGG
jgi:hypothetical protein